MARFHLNWRKLLTWTLLLALAAGSYYYWRQQQIEPAAARYRTAPVERGDITQTVSANGTLNPVVLVSVGTQVSGTVRRIYADFNERVRQGEILAELDPSLIEAQLAQSRAALANAEASLRLAEANEQRARALYAKDYIARAELDQARQALETARGQVASARAQMARDRTNLGYTVIRSPVSGVVVSRDVDVGQTVAASFQTPTLFKIAQDLRRMQIDTSVAEADIGSVRVGQPARFTVDAFPNRQFQGMVRQIRLNPTIQQNVVTYNVVIAVDNPEEILLPGMTAFVTIVVEQHRNVLRVPNAALRFRPAAADDEGERRPAEAGRTGGTTVYRLEGERLTPVSIRTGITDNRHTEVLAGALRPGDRLVVADLSAKKQEKNQGGRFRVGF